MKNVLYVDESHLPYQSDFYKYSFNLILYNISVFKEN